MENQTAKICICSAMPLNEMAVRTFLENNAQKIWTAGILLKQENQHILSSYAFDEKNLSMEWLQKQGLLNQEDQILSRDALLHRAYRNYSLDLNFMNFSFQEYARYYAAYMVFHKENKDLAWGNWPDDMRDYPVKGMDVRPYQEEILYQVFLQYELFLQWKNFKSQCMDHEIAILGVLPLHIDKESADGWSHRELFSNDDYDWQAMKKEKYRWFIDRIAYTERIYDGCILTGIEETDHLNDLSEAMEALRKQDEDLKIYLPLTDNPAVLKFQQRFHLESVSVEENRI